MTDNLPNISRDVANILGAATAARILIEQESAFTFAASEPDGESNADRAMMALDGAAEKMLEAVAVLREAVQLIADARHLSLGINTVNVGD